MMVIRKECEAGEVNRTIKQGGWEMKYLNTFLMSMAVSTCVFMAGRFINAETTSLFNGSKVIIDECGVEGQLVREDDGIYARFTVSNETKNDRDLSFHYAVNHTPAGSMMSRMGPIPEQVKVEECKVTVPACGSEHVEVLIKKEARPEKTINMEEAAKFIPAEYWSLAVAKDPIKKVAGFGAVIPAIATGRVELKNGSVVLDSGVIEGGLDKRG